MKKRGRHHISQSQPEHLQEELTRGLLGRWLDRGAMIASQHRTLGRRVLEEPRANVKRSSPQQDPGDARQLRGIPVVGVKGGMGGAIPGSRPGDGIKLANDDEAR